MEEGAYVDRKVADSRPERIVGHRRDFKQGHVQWLCLYVWKIILITVNWRAVKVDAGKGLRCGTSSSGER